MKYPSLAIAPTVVAALVVAFVVACSDEPTEEPALQPQQEDTQACRTPSPQSEAPAEVTPEGTPHLQSGEEALAQDLALTAEAQGITVEEAEARFTASEIVGLIAARLAAERPNALVGFDVATEPGGSPKLYIKGPADDFVRELVAAAGVEIEIIDNQPYSRGELDEREAQVVRALRDHGFSNFGVGTDITNAHIDAAVTRQEGLPEDPDEILAGLPEELRDSVTLTFSDCPVGSYD
jgi:hypothetical protein